MDNEIELEKEFVPREQAIALRDLGFDEKCMAYHGKQDTMMGMLYSNIYNGNTFHNAVATPSEKHLDVYAPTYRQAFKFFRKNLGMKFYIREDMWNDWCGVKILKDNTDKEYKEVGSYNSYEKAELACLNSLIEIAKNKSNKK
jgi:hypothetical protein